MFVVLGTVGTRGVHDDGDGFVVGVFSMAHLAERAEELGSNVGENTGAFGGDAIADKEKQEPGEELVDLIGGVEFGELVEKVGGEVVRVFLALAETGVTEAETGAGIPGRELARMACAGPLLATDGALRPGPFAMAPFVIALGKLGRAEGQVLRRERVR
jgi:hypothetical protein